MERERRRGARGCEGPGVAGGRLILEAFRDGGPRNREGGGGRWGWGLAAEEGERVDILECYFNDDGEWRLDYPQVQGVLAKPSERTMPNDDISFAVD